MGKVALITGASSGIGEATARALADDGYNLIVTGRRTERLAEFKKELESGFGIKVHVLAFDIRRRRDCEAAIETLPQDFSQIDVLVNNAGLARGLEPFFDGDPNDWDEMADTNIKGMLYITRKVVRDMVARRSGHIVNLGSIAGTQPYANGGVYCATKHAVHALSQGMRIDLLPYGVKVTEVRPGWVETEFSIVRFHGDTQRATDFYEGVKPLAPEDVAETVAWALSQPPHVNIDEIVLTPAAQANAYYTFKKDK